MLYPCPLIMGDRGMFVTRFCFSLQLCRISYINVLCGTNDVTVAIGPCLSAVTTLLADGVGCKASPSYLLLVAWPASEQLSPLLLPHRTPFGIECEVVADPSSTRTRLKTCRTTSPLSWATQHTLQPHSDHVLQCSSQWQD